MSIPIVRNRERIEETTYMLSFDRIPYDGSGFAFDCDADGNLLESVIDTARATYAECLTGIVRGDRVTAGRVRAFRHSYWQAALGKCDCGHVIELASFTNTCERCGRDYSMSGSHLAPRSQWGEETGESAADILSIGHTIS